MTDEPEAKKQMGVALGRDLKARLQDAADASGHSIAEEIRRRLEYSFELEHSSMSEMAKAALWIAEEVRVEADSHTWWKIQSAHDVFAAALRAWLDSVRPEDDGGELTFHGDDVETLGRSIARRYQRHRSEEAEGEKILRTFRKGSKL
jgi:hypothetical protein